MSRIVLVALAACLLAAPAAAQDETLAERIAKAQALEAEGKADEALAEYAAVVRAIPADAVEAHRDAIVRAYVLTLARNDLEAAEALFRDAHRLRPEDDLSAYYLAEVLARANKGVEAKALLRALGEGRGPYAANAWQRLGHHLVYTEKAYTEVAADAYLAFLQIEAAIGRAADPSVKPGFDLGVELVHYVASQLLNSGQDTEASSRLWLALADLEPVPRPRRGKFVLYVSMSEYQCGEFAKAEALARTAMELAPEDAEIVNNLGLVLMARKDVPGAVKCFERTLEMDPGYTDAMENLGIYHLKRGRPGEARGFFRRAFALACERAPAWAKAAAEEGADPTLEIRAKKERFRRFRLETYLRELATVE